MRVRNTHASRGGAETVMLFAIKRKSTVPAPRIVLAAFEKVHLRAGEAADVALTVRLSSIAVVHERGGGAWDAVRVVEEGPVDLYIGGNPQWTHALHASTNVSSTAALDKCGRP